MKTKLFYFLSAGLILVATAMPVNIGIETASGDAVAFIVISQDDAPADTDSPDKPTDLRDSSDDEEVPTDQDVSWNS